MNKKTLLQELSFKTALSGGPGGQHVNKTETKVILEWDLTSTEAFSETTKIRLKEKLNTQLTKEEVLQLQCAQSRSQHKNKKLVIERFLDLIKKALQQKKKRKPTKPSKAAKLKRLKRKKQHSEKKANRKKPKI